MQNNTKNDIKAAQSETIAQLAHRHLLDPKHTTSDEELRNARIEFNEDFDTPQAKLSEVAE